MEEEEKTNDKKTQQSESTWWGSWGQGWIDTVREKSAITLEMVKKDLNEFVEVIQGDTSTVISETATKLDDATKEKEATSTESKTTVVKQGLSKFLHHVSELMAIQPDDSKDEFITLSDYPFSAQSYNRKQEKLYVIQTDPGTYCNEPEGLFDDWLVVFNLDEHKEEMSNLLIQNPSVRGIYTQLVPVVVLHTTFWQRYFYQVFLLDAEEKRREELVARANKESSKDDVDDGWDDEDDDDIEVVSQPISKKSPINDTAPKLEATSNGMPEKVTISKDVSNIADVEKEDEHSNENISAIKACPVDDRLSNDSVSLSNANVIKTEAEPSSQNNVLLATEKVKNISIESTSKVDTSTDIIKPDETSLNKSCDTIKTDNEWEEEKDKELNDMKYEMDIKNESHSPNHPRLQVVHDLSIKQEHSETSSVSSWMSIDDDIKVKKIKEEQVVKQEPNGASESKSSSGSSAILINKSDADDLDDDFDLDLDDDVNEEDLAKMVEEIKNKSAAGTLQDDDDDDDDDDDWENWE